MGPLLSTEPKHYRVKLMALPLNRTATTKRKRMKITSKLLLAAEVLQHQVHFREILFRVAKCS